MTSQKDSSAEGRKLLNLLTAQFVEAKRVYLALLGEREQLELSIQRVRERVDALLGLIASEQERK